MRLFTRWLLPPFPPTLLFFFPSFPIISVSHGELACQAAPLLCIASHVLIFLDLSVASHTIAHSLYFAHLLSLISQTFLLGLPLTFLVFHSFFAGHSSFTQPLHARLSWGSVLGSIFPHGYFIFSSALDTSGLLKEFLYLAKIYTDHLQYI